MRDGLLRSYKELLMSVKGAINNELRLLERPVVRWATSSNSSTRRTC